MKNSITLLLLCFFSTPLISQLDMCPAFEFWEKYYIPESQIECGSISTEFEETFEGNTLDATKWTTFTPCWPPNQDNPDDCAPSRLKDMDQGINGGIIRDENVRVNNGTCKLLITYPDDPENNTWFGRQRNYNVGKLRGIDPFTFGRYEADIRTPDEQGFWEAFWLWHHDEIDILEFADEHEFLTNNLPSNASGYECDHNFRNPTNVVGSWHNFALEWTPFKLSFFLDKAPTPYYEVFRYYDEQMNPMDFECGDVIPAGNYMINPEFPQLYRRYFRPTFDNTVWDDGNTPIPSGIGSPASTMEIDNVKVLTQPIDVCGGFQYEVPDKNKICLLEEHCIRVLPMGDADNFVKIVNSSSSANIELNIDISPWNQMEGFICFTTKDLSAGLIQLEYLDECDNIQQMEIEIPAAGNTSCDCDLRVEEDLVIEGLNGSFNSIRIGEGVTLTITNSFALFAEGGEIYLDESAKLIVDNSILGACVPGTLWQGIIAEKDARGVELLNGSLISSAEIGIRLSEVAWFDPTPIQANSFHPYLIMDNSRIKDCNVGLQFGYGLSNSEIRNSSQISENNTGILYTNHSGLIIDDTNFHGNTEAIRAVDAHMYVRGGNTFFNGEYGITIEGTLPLTTGIDIGDMDADHNVFGSIENYALECQGVEHPTGAFIVNCRIDNTITATTFFGAAQYRYANNTLSNTASGVFSSATGDNFNSIQCNELSDMSNQGIIYQADNSQSEFLENHFLGENHHVNANVWYATVKSAIGTAENPASNCFSNTGIDLVAEESSNFIYHYYDDGDELACQEPFNEGSYEKLLSEFPGDHCDGQIGTFNLIVPPGGGGLIGIDPPVGFTKSKVQGEILIGITAVVAGGGDDPRTYEIERTEHQAPDLSKREEALDQWIRYGIYMALREHDFDFAEDILGPLLKWRWQSRLFGLKVIRGDISGAQQLLNVMPAQRTEEAYFKGVQAINLKRFVSGAKLSDISPTDLNYLLSVAESSQPSAGYARSLYRILTGISLPIEIPVWDSPQNPLPKLGQIETNAKLLVYPNPVKEELIIQLVNAEALHCQIFSNTGNLRHRQSSNYEKMTINVHDFSAGMYFLKVLSKDGIVYISKFIKE